MGPLLAVLIATVWAASAIAATPVGETLPLFPPETAPQQGNCVGPSGPLTWLKEGAVTVFFQRSPDPLGISTPVGSMVIEGSTLYGFCLDATTAVVDDTYCFVSNESDWRIAYLVSKYPPNPGDRLVQAGRQAAMWHYTNGLNILRPNATSEGEAASAAVIAEYDKILADVDSYGGSTPAIFGPGEVEMTVTPASASTKTSQQLTVRVTKGGVALPNIAVSISSSLGAVSPSNGTTGSSGEVVFTVSSGAKGTANVVVSSDIVVPAGQRFQVVDTSRTEQPLGVGDPTTLARSASASISFSGGTPPPTPKNIPEPITIVLFGTGLAGIAAAAARRRKQ
jgi:hypothetical protein